MNESGRGRDTGAEAGAQPRAVETPRMGLAARLRNYFLAGILVTAPVGITFWLAWKAIAFIDARVTPLIPPRWNPETYLPFALPGFGLIIALVFLTLVGFLAAGYSGRLVMRLSESLVARVPVARSIYSWTKQVFETVLSQKATAFNEVVMIEYPCRGVWAIGFITGKTEGEVQDLTKETVYNVFVPATPNPTTGFLLFIPERDVHHLDLTVEDGIKLVISGGIVTPGKLGRRRVAETKGAEAQGKPGGAPGLGFVRKLRNYFLAGILVTAPISITIWLGWEFVSYVDDRVTPFIPPAWNPETYLPFGVPGLGVLLVVAVMTLIGFFTAGLVGRTLVGLGERMLDRMPVIRSVYGAVKQIVETVFKEQSKAFREVVLVEYPRPESWAIGFITGQTEGHVQDLTPRRVVNVFLPTTPNPTSGFLLFVPRDEVQVLAMTVEEGIKMVVSGGIVTPPDRRAEPTPAEEETDGAEVAKTA
ncbi:MAG: DUF502 domain-containing protein [Kiloniellaceae bacterium]